MTIGERIKLRREQLGLTQDELAKLVGYTSRSAINKIEKDGRELRQNKIAIIAEVLNTTPAYIMGWEEEQTIDNSQAKCKILIYYEALNDKGKKEAEKRVQELTYIPMYTQKTEIIQAAHARTDIEITDEMVKHDNDIMDDDNF